MSRKPRIYCMDDPEDKALIGRLVRERPGMSACVANTKAEALAGRYVRMYDMKWTATSGLISGTCRAVVPPKHLAAPYAD